MSTETQQIEDLANQEYKYGFYTDIETDSAPPGLNEDIIRLISAKKKEPEFMLKWRLKAYKHWLTMKEPTWANVQYGPIDYQSIVYYSAPKRKEDGPQSIVKDRGAFGVDTSQGHFHLLDIIGPVQDKPGRIIKGDNSHSILGVQVLGESQCGLVDFPLGLTGAPADINQQNDVHRHPFTVKIDNFLLDSILVDLDLFPGQIAHKSTRNGTGINRQENLIDRDSDSKAFSLLLLAGLLLPSGEETQK